MSSKALLVGIARYSTGSGLTALSTPENDACALEALLKDPASGFVASPKLSVTSNDLRRAVEAFFIRASDQDVLLFYFSGHGKLGQNGGLYLCPSDTEADLIDATAVSLSWFKQVIDRCIAKQIIVILDCCYSGEAHLAMKGDIPSTIQSNIGGGRGKYLITSSTNYQVSLERPGDKNSLFTKWLIKGVESGEADLNDDGVITIEELFQYTLENVTREYPSQTPQFWKWGTSPGDAIIRGQSTPSLATSLGEDPFYIAARDMFALKTAIVPFLGAGIFGRGPLSAYQMTAAMCAQAGLKSTVGSASEIAQHLKNIYGRDQFLSFYGRLLREQAKSVSSCASLELVERTIKSGESNFVVSLTNDCQLEDILRNRGKSFSILSHVLASDEKAEVGKLLVVKIDRQIEYKMCLSDEWLPDAKDDVVIYKILGSPFLSDLTERRDLDTVVVTEEDFGCLFGFFENEHRKSPSAVTRWLQKRPSIFLGFALDVWEYRLLTVLLEQSMGQALTRRGRRYAVREPTTPIETLCWQRLGMDLIRMEPQEFTSTLLAQDAALS
ncbi:caspase family protein [Bradyrhizobium ottawaense]|uniref:caspase family protein n=1 Tax=Bradyrhizobium ottawaense TaxID=931866 RepID=UPI001BAC8E81|nr:caspase family protein [Bradyrhizobium ottawaense]